MGEGNIREIGVCALFLQVLWGRIGGEDIVSDDGFILATRERVHSAESALAWFWLLGFGFLDYYINGR